jgi:hypothetical protein
LAKKIGEKFALLMPNTAELCKKIHWFLRKTPKNLAKIAENCGHNIDPWA